MLAGQDMRGRGANIGLDGKCSENGVFGGAALHIDWPLSSHSSTSTSFWFPPETQLSSRVASCWMPAPHVLLVRPADRTELSVLLKAVGGTSTSLEPWQSLGGGGQQGQNWLRMRSMVRGRPLSAKGRSGDGMKAGTGLGKDHEKGAQHWW